MPTDAGTLKAFNSVYDEAVARGGEIDYRLAAPRWQFLCHVADRREVVLHGSGNAQISIFEPRQSDDVNEFGDRKAVYAASDGIWPIYFAILDRDRYPMSLINSSARFDLGEGRLSDPHYFFSIAAEALAQRPYRRGSVYLLPRASFEQQAAIQLRGTTIWPEQWASLEPVRPLARLAVGPEDFPFLAQMRGHDTEETFAHARTNPDDFPWIDDPA